MALPTYATVLMQINTYIVANGNNEITANVLNPILELILDFANNNIGDLDALTTDEKNSIVEAINSLKQNFDDLVNNGVQLYTGIDNPNDVPPPTYNYADFYMQVDIDSLPVKLWQWNGFQWTDESGEPATESDNVNNNSGVPGVSVTDALNNVLINITISEIRSLSGDLENPNFYTTDLGQEGKWYYDASDTTSTDNTGTVLVTSDGKRIKRVLCGIINVKWFGAIGDESTDDTNAVFNALDVSKDLNFTCFFPYGTYYISHIGSFGHFSGSTLSSNEKTVLSLLDSPNVSNDVNVLNPIKVKLRYLNSEIWLSPKNKRKESERNSSINSNDAKFQINKLVDLTELGYSRIDWPGGDTYTPYVPISLTSDKVVLEGVDASLTLALDKMEIGKTSTIQFKETTGGEIVVYIKTTTNTYGIFCGTGDSSAPAFFSKALGVSGNSAVFNYYGLGTHASYASYRSNISIRTMSKTAFSILYNGQVIKNNIKVIGDITDIGFGITFNGSVAITDWVNSYSDLDEGKSIIKIAAFGDSRTDDDEYENWLDYTKKYLDGTAGIRVHELYNYAVSGQNISQQKILCTTPNIQSSDIVIIDIGTNDIQANTNEDTFANDLRDMVDVCLASEKRVIIGLPDLFYTQAQSGARGQLTSNYQMHKGIRAKCMSVATEKGVYFLDKAQILGPILAQYVDPSISGSFTSLDLDPILYDNIHPTTYARMLIGKDYAKAILAVLMDHPDKYKGKENYLSKWNSTSQQTFTGWQESISGNRIFNGVDDGVNKLQVTGRGSFSNGIIIPKDVALILGQETSTNFGQIYFSNATKKLIFTRSNGDATLEIDDATKIVKINTLSGTGTRQVVTDASGNLSATTTPVDSRPYKTYTVLITQTGTSDPTVTILENGIGAIIWTRTGVGTYSGTLTGAFTLNKTAQFIGNSNTCFVNLGSSGSNVVDISTYNAVGVISDGLLGSASYEIRVYN